jgi:hypothetical protein
MLAVKHTLKGGASLAVAPNPAQGQATARFELLQEGAVRLVLLDLGGRQVEAWTRGDLPAGEQIQRLDLSGKAPGLYFLVLEQDQGAGNRVLGLFKLAVAE